jgi:hypothetical protein
MNKIHHTSDSMTPEMAHYIKNQDHGVKSSAGGFGRKRGSQLLQRADGYPSLANPSLLSKVSSKGKLNADGVFGADNMFGNDNIYPAYSHSAFGMKSPLSQPKYQPEEKYKNMKKDYYRYNLISNRVSSFANEKSTERSTDKDPIFSSRR